MKVYKNLHKNEGESTCVKDAPRVAQQNNMNFAKQLSAPSNYLALQSVVGEPSYELSVFAQSSYNFEKCHKTQGSGRTSS